ncbi:class C beta-lactamase [Pseudomonas sp. Leaf58]|uniref:class C beta-lactamase n=1 Tax=Pseudomonas sp. Leaf58 TaxID=1736226 RepID=UPI0006FE207E|nr:class C beta-lactamase [Pseudomonas sp. Leaf58]AYG45253.1 class C beta-lactamase [Pseudomonas sp. Leaf58]KQN59198.1 class C beta-lactamase [Pseudomonas sp. Leaf58]
MPLNRLAALAAAITLCLGHAAAQADDPLHAKVDRIIRPLMQEQGIAGMAVAIYARDHAHYFNYGVASKADNVPVSQDTLFEIGSLSKTYTATLVALASAEGKLDLNAPAKRYHPALAGAPLGDATVLELGTYSAACLPLQFPDTVQTQQQVVAFFRHWQPRAKPGSQRCYSNPSLGLFGDLGARAQQQPFATLMTYGLLAKMGLKDTYLTVPDSAQGRYAQGYDAADQPVRVGPGPYADEAYGIKTSASDLLHYVRLHMQPAGLPPALVQATAITQRGYFQVSAMTQGLGWERYPYPVTLSTLIEGNSPRLIREPQATTRLQPALPALPAAWYNKTGATNGFGAYAAFVPAEQLAVVLLANRNYPNEARVRAAFEILSGL